jgi:hypothetical protein
MNYRPYISIFQNSVQIVNEISICIAYCFCGLFYWETGIDIVVHVWIVLGCVYFSYTLHLGVMIIKLIQIIITKLRTCRNRESLMG